MGFVKYYIAKVIATGSGPGLGMRTLRSGRSWWLLGSRLSVRQMLAIARTMRSG